MRLRSAQPRRRPAVSLARHLLNRLERYVNFNNKKFYYIRHFTDYNDGTVVETETEKFPGKERRAALARFVELKKQYPGIVAEMDIDKKAWER